MKYLFVILALFLIGCDDDSKRTGIVGEYWDGVGTIDEKEIIFIYVFEYPADQSIGVSYATENETFLCRYFKVIDQTYVSMPLLDDDSKTDINIYGGRFSAKSEGTSEDPCRNLKITTSFRLY